MHTDVIWRFTWSHLHIITWLLYSAYLLLLFQAWKGTKIDEDPGGVHNRKHQRRWLIVNFVFMHLLALRFCMDGAWFSECVFHKALAVDLRVRAIALASAASVCVPGYYVFA